MFDAYPPIGVGGNRQCDTLSLFCIPLDICRMIRVWNKHYPLCSHKPVEINATNLRLTAFHITREDFELKFSIQLHSPNSLFLRQLRICGL